MTTLPRRWPAATLLCRAGARKLAGCKRKDADVAQRDGVVVGESAREQTLVVLENLAAVLDAAGASPADVVRCGVYLDDMADFTEMDEAYATMFPDPLPARTTVAVTLRGFKVEIDCIVVLPPSE